MITFSAVNLRPRTDFWNSFADSLAAYVRLETGAGELTASMRMFLHRFRMNVYKERESGIALKDGKLMPWVGLPVGQAPGSGDLLSFIISLVWLIPWMLILFFPGFNQKLQMRTILMDVERKLAKLKVIRDEVRGRTIETVKRLGKPSEDPVQKIDQLMEFFTIPPESMDPYGIVGKLDHLMKVGENQFEKEVRAISPAAEEYQVKNLSNLLDASQTVNTLYRVVRHYYLLGKKTSNIYLVLQIQMIMPQIMEIAEAYRRASTALAKGQPIGDGAGALVAATIAHEKERNRREIAKDTTVSEMDLDGRRLLIVRATGPGGTTGRTGEAVEKLVEREKKKVQLIITVDAQLKLEGEDTGKINEAVGVAIGGTGVEKFRIEEVSKKYDIPIHAVLISESLTEAVTPMRQSIAKAADEASDRVKKIVTGMTEAGATVILAGIGNTIGIG